MQDLGVINQLRIKQQYSKSTCIADIRVRCLRHVTYTNRRGERPSSVPGTRHTAHSGSSTCCTHWREQQPGEVAFAVPAGHQHHQHHRHQTRCKAKTSLSQGATETLGLLLVICAVGLMLVGHVGCSSSCCCCAVVCQKISNSEIIVGAVVLSFSSCVANDSPRLFRLHTPSPFQRWTVNAQGAEGLACSLYPPQVQPKKPPHRHRPPRLIAPHFSSL